MIALDEDALICDFMETYGILDFRTLPVQKAAILASGLRADSRIKMLLKGIKTDDKTLLLGVIADALNTLVWFQSENGLKNINRPVSIVHSFFMSGREEADNEIVGFSSAEAYENERKRIIGG